MKNQISNVVPFPQEGDHQAHVQLLGFLESGVGKHLGLTRQKYLERGELLPSNDSPGKYILSMERHRPVAGCCYRPGSPMAAFETYLQAYEFDPVAMDLQETSATHIDYTFDLRALAEEHMLHYASVSVMLCGDSMRKVELSAINWSLNTSSLAEAKAEVEEQIREMCLEGIFEDLDDVYETNPCIESEFLDACIKCVLEDLEKRWNEAEVDDDE